MSTSVRSFDHNAYLKQDTDSNIIKLKLKKPKAWNWELSTSKSSPSINFPKILLYDHNDRLLARANESNCVINDRESSSCFPHSGHATSSHKSSVDSLKNTQIINDNVQTSFTVDKVRKHLPNEDEAKSKHFPIENEIKHFIDNFSNQLKRNGIDCKVSNGASSNCSRRSSERSSTNSKRYHQNLIENKHSMENVSNGVVERRKSISDIHQNTTIMTKQSIPEQPVYVYTERGMVQRDFNAKEFDRFRKSSTLQQQKQHTICNAIEPNTNQRDASKENKLENGKYLQNMTINENSLVAKNTKNFSIKKSKSALEVHNTATPITGSNNNEKKKYRRTHSTNSLKFSSSILERKSDFKRRSSSTDSQEFEEIENPCIDTLENKSKYMLRTSQAGTLVVCRDSFSNKKIRRRPRSIGKINEIDNCTAISGGQVDKEKHLLNKYKCDILPEYEEKVAEENSASPSFQIESTRYEKAIENIDNLIKVMSQELNYPKTKLINGNSGNFFPQTNVSNNKVSSVQENAISTAGIMKSKSNQLSNYYSEDENVCGGMAKRKKKISRKSFELNCCTASRATTDAASSCKQDKDHKNEKNCGQMGDCVKLNKKRKGKKMRRSVSAGSDRYGKSKLSSSSSSDDEDEAYGIVRRNKNVLMRGRRRGRIIITVDKIDSMATKNGDQIVAIQKNIQHLDTSTSTSTLLKDSNDQEVILNLVRRLASLQQQQNFKNNKCDTTTNNNNNNHILLIDSEQLSNVDPYDCSSRFDDKTIESENIANNNKSLNESSDENSLSICEIDSTIMGSNVSRHSGKGLSGRRTQSSGDLCNEKHQTPNGSYYTPTSKRKTENGKSNALHCHHNNEDENNIIAESCPVNATSKLMAPLCVYKKDRNNFCGSLPNHLDADDVCEENGVVNAAYNYVENNNTLDKVEYVTVAPRNYHNNHHHHHHHHQILQQVESLPYNNSSSEKESTSSSTNLGSTFRNTNHESNVNVQLKLPINRSNFDTGCDQGYGSERSPEDELPPPLPLLPPQPYQQPIHQQIKWEYDKYNGCEYSFITQDCCFTVQITKGPRGLGLSVSGGIDTNAAFPGLIRIKRLFPHQSAWSTGMLQPGDILLAANGIVLTGLTNYEALEVLRTTPNLVTLTVCRPRDEQYRKLSPPSEPPKPPERTHHHHHHHHHQQDSLPSSLDSLYPIQTYYSREFEIIMVKQQGSLGFTLRKEDESVLGHYVRALVREPALSDGRIRPADKIVAVNDVPLCPMSHEEAVIFLRQSADTVKLRLYREENQTPVAAMSPTNNENQTILSGTNGKQKVCLRPEAINLLSDIAYRNKKHYSNPDSTGSSFRSNTTSPRRLRRGTKNSSGTTSSHNETDKTDSKSFSYPNYIVTNEQTSSSVCSDSEHSTMSQSSFIVQQQSSTENLNNETYTIPENTEFYGEDELWKMDAEDGSSATDLSDKTNRPSYLDLAGNSGSTPVVSRKPRFQFTVAANAYELNNLDNEALDAPIYINPNQSTDQHIESSQDFASLPCETFLVACKTENDFSLNGEKFSHNNPMYQSAHVQLTVVHPTASGDKDQSAAAPPSAEVKKDGTKSLLKWKGVMFSSDEEEKETTPEADSSCMATVGTNPTPGTEKDFDFNGLATDGDGHKIIIVELNRGWNSRLGFSLQNNSNTKETFISAIYNDSVAARDGRLQVGDQVLMVNDESVEHRTTAEIIDLLRIIRGSICLTVLRKDNYVKNS